MLNRCEFIGNLGRDPEIRTTQSGDKVANLRIAVSEKWKDRDTGERKERTEWIPVTIWGPLAKVAEQYLHKGSKVFVSGKFQTRKWQDQSGADRYSTEIVLQGPQSQLTMLDGPKDNNRPDPHRSQEPEGYGSGGRPGGDIDHEIPFLCEWRV